MLPWMWGLAVQTVLRSSNVSLDTCLRLWRLLWERIVGSYQCRSWNNSFLSRWSFVCWRPAQSTFVLSTTLSCQRCWTPQFLEKRWQKWNDLKGNECILISYVLHLSTNSVYVVPHFACWMKWWFEWAPCVHSIYIYIYLYNILFGHIGVKQNIYGGSGT